MHALLVVAGGTGSVIRPLEQVGFCYQAPGCEYSAGYSVGRMTESHCRLWHVLTVALLNVAPITIAQRCDRSMCENGGILHEPSCSCSCPPGWAANCSKFDSADCSCHDDDGDQGGGLWLLSPLSCCCIICLCAGICSNVYGACIQRKMGSPGKQGTHDGTRSGEYSSHTQGQL